MKFLILLEELTCNFSKLNRYKDMGIAKDNITLKQQDEFVAGVTKGLLEMGAVKQPKNELSFDNTEFKLETIAGTLIITLYRSQKFLFTVYSRFEEPTRSKDKFNCNPHSGKYNFHRSKGKSLPTIKKVIECALMHFECTLQKELA